jgi:hypothetical protein
MTRALQSPTSLTVRVPFRLVKRGGRKEIQLPDGAPLRPSIDSTLIKALARAFRWKHMLDSGEFATIAELAEREGIAAPYLTRTMRLAQLAPEVVEAILEGRQPRGLTLQTLRCQIPDDWSKQRATLQSCSEQGLRHPYTKL